MFIQNQLQKIQKEIDVASEVGEVYFYRQKALDFNISLHQVDLSPRQRIALRRLFDNEWHSEGKILLNLGLFLNNTSYRMVLKEWQETISTLESISHPSSRDMVMQLSWHGGLFNLQNTLLPNFQNATIEILEEIKNKYPVCRQLKHTEKELTLLLPLIGAHHGGLPQDVSKELFAIESYVLKSKNKMTSLPIQRKTL
jgi:hypothetical protein